MALPTNDDINQLEFIYNGLPFLDNIYDSISVTVFIPILMII